MYYQFDSRLNMPAILFDDDRLVVGRNEYDYNDLEEIRITKSPFLSTYGIFELKTRGGKTVPVPFVKGDLHRIRTAVQELAHLLKMRRANEAAETAAARAEIPEASAGAGGLHPETREEAALSDRSDSLKAEEKGSPAPVKGAVTEPEAAADPKPAVQVSGAGTVGAGAGQAVMDPYEEMKKLKELLDLEIVTQEEFDRKKKQLLGL